MIPKKKRSVKQDQEVQLKRMLSKRGNVCYILITCGEPTEEGKMNVEMSYEGDADLAAYLLHSAQNFFD